MSTAAVPPALNAAVSTAPVLTPASLVTAAVVIPAPTDSARARTTMTTVLVSVNQSGPPFGFTVDIVPPGNFYRAARASAGRGPSWCVPVDGPSTGAEFRVNRRSHAHIGCGCAGRPVHLLEVSTRQLVQGHKG